MSVANSGDSVSQLPLDRLKTKLDVVQATLGQLSRPALGESKPTGNQVCVQSIVAGTPHQGLKILALQRLAPGKAYL